MSSAPGARPPRTHIGIVADENGALQRQTVDRSPNQQSVLDRQFTLVAEGLAKVDAMETKYAALESLVLQLADGLSAHRANTGEAIVSATESLAALRGHYSETASAMRTIPLQLSRAEDGVRLLNDRVQGMPTRDEFDGLVALTQALRDEVAAFRRVLSFKVAS